MQYTEGCRYKKPRNLESNYKEGSAYYARNYGNKLNAAFSKSSNQRNYVEENNRIENMKKKLLIERTGKKKKRKISNLGSIGPFVVTYF